MVSHVQLPEGPLFAALGINESEERAYSWLLAHSEATVTDVARALNLTNGRARQLLGEIESKGLATHSPERPRRYFPVSPDIGLEASALRRQEELNRARENIRALQKRMALEHQSENERMVEVIASSEAERRTFEQVHRSARHEVIGLVRPPLRISRLDDPTDEDESTQREAQHRGVRYRGIVDSAYLALPGAVQATRREIETGQDIRAASELPFKMILVDRRVAFIPLSLERVDSPTLVVRSSALLDALYAFFEVLWERASPLVFNHEGELEDTSERTLSREAEELVPYLAAGLNDKRIAHELGVSRSTLNRRITAMMKELDARSRFQLGWLAGRHVPEPSDHE
jgi:sugar-specific transcriptional regulator TrmB/DNA-binding CsgD family transcriptional regulator